MIQLRNYEEATNQETQIWLIENLPNMTSTQRRAIVNGDLLLRSPYKFYKVRPKTESNIWWRLSFIGLVIVALLMFAWLPVHFMIKGRWGYKDIDWFEYWANKCGFK